MKSSFKILLVTVIAISALSSSAFAWNYGDVFAAIGSGLVNRYDAAGNFIETLNTGVNSFTTGMGFDQASNLYVTGFDGNYVARFQSNSAFLDYWGSGYNANPESIVFDATGNAYVGQPDGSKQVIKFDAAGTPTNFFSVLTEDRGSDWLDLAADQKTLYYTSEGTSVLRYDVSTGTQLSDFATGLGGPAYALRILGDGSVLVANTSDIVHLDAAGNIMQTYDVGGEDTWFALNIDPGGNTFWSGNFGTGNAYQFDISSGAVLNTIATGSSSFFGLTVYGEQTAGVTPEPGTLMLLGSGLAGLGLLRRRRK